MSTVHSACVHCWSRDCQTSFHGSVIGLGTEDRSFVLVVWKAYGNHMEERARCLSLSESPKGTPHPRTFPNAMISLQCSFVYSFSRSAQKYYSLYSLLANALTTYRNQHHHHHHLLKAEDRSLSQKCGTEMVSSISIWL